MTLPLSLEVNESLGVAEQEYIVEQRTSEDGEKEGCMSCCTIKKNEPLKTMNDPKRSEDLHV